MKNPIRWFKEQNTKGQELMRERNILPFAYKSLMLFYGVFYLLAAVFLFWIIKGNSVIIAFIAAGVSLYFSLKYLTEWWTYRKVF